MALVCKICGYKQYDEETIKTAKKIHIGVEEHDIPYYCGACIDTASDSEYQKMMKEMNDNQEELI